MVSICDHHHDGHQLVDLTALQMEITQTFTNFSAFLDTLAPLPLQTNSMKPTAMTMTSISMDDACLVGC